MDTLNVVIADDHPIVLVGVRELIERDPRFRVVGEAVCSNELVNLLASGPVDLVVTDFNMPGDSPYGDGLKLVEYLTRHFPSIRVVVLTMISNPWILTAPARARCLGRYSKKPVARRNPGRAPSYCPW